MRGTVKRAVKRFEEKSGDMTKYGPIGFGWREKTSVENTIKKNLRDLVS